MTNLLLCINIGVVGFIAAMILVGGRRIIREVEDMRAYTARTAVALARQVGEAADAQASTASHVASDLAEHRESGCAE